VQISNMPNMQQIETSIRQRDLVALRPPGLHTFL
jgi:hypothetical protein